MNVSATGPAGCMTLMGRTIPYQPPSGGMAISLEWAPSVGYHFDNVLFEKAVDPISTTSFSTLLQDRTHRYDLLWEIELIRFCWWSVSSQRIRSVRKVARLPVTWACPHMVAFMKVQYITFRQSTVSCGHVIWLQVSPHVALERFCCTKTFFA